MEGLLSVDDIKDLLLFQTSNQKYVSYGNMIKKEVFYAPCGDKVADTVQLSLKKLSSSAEWR